MLFHGELQSYSRAQKQNTKPESKRQVVIRIIEWYKDFHLYDKFLLSSAQVCYNDFTHDMLAGLLRSRSKWLLSQS